MLGYSGEELDRMTVFDFTHAEYIDYERNLYQEVLSGERTFSD